MEQVIMRLQNTSLTKTIAHIVKRKAQGLDLRLISEGDMIKHPDDFRPTVEDLFESRLHTYKHKYQRDHAWQPESGFGFFSIS